MAAKCIFILIRWYVPSTLKACIYIAHVAPNLVSLVDQYHHSAKARATPVAVIMQKGHFMLFEHQPMGL